MMAEKSYDKLNFTLVQSLKRKIEALSASESNYRTLLENLPQKIFLKGRDLVYISCNQAYAQDLSIRPEEIKGKTDHDFYPKKLAEKYRADDRKIMDACKTEEIEESYIQDGKELFVHTVKVPVKNEKGKVSGVLGIFWDITEKKKAEDALRETREYLDNLLNYANAPIIVWDNNKNITLFNKAFEYFTGHKQEAILGKKIDLLFPPSQKTKILQTIEQATHGEKWKTVEIPILCTDQKTKIALWNSANITDRDGRLIATIAQGQDITEKKKAEEALKESEEKFRAVFECSNDGILAADTETKRFVFANPKICKITGYSAEELLKLSLDDIHPKKDLAYVVSCFKKQAQGKLEVAKDLPVLRKDRKVVYCDVNSAPTKTGGRDFLVGFFRDVTERKKAEERLRYFQNAVDGSSDAIGMSTPEGKHYYQNEAFNKMFGLTVEEVRGAKGPPTVYADKEVGREVFKTIMGGGSWEGEVEMKTKRGKLLTVFERAYSIKDEKGKVIGLVGVHTDITEKKKTEEKLVEQKERYETEIKELKKKLQKIK